MQETGVGAIAQFTQLPTERVTIVVRLVDQRVLTVAGARVPAGPRGGGVRVFRGPGNHGGKVVIAMRDETT